jgi:hypothetical protein
LGRFRRQNDLTVSGLGRETGIGGACRKADHCAIARREKLSKIVQVDVARLQQMLPPKGVGMKMTPIRLCGACYGETPCHLIEWQLKTTEFCSQHGLTLWSECPNCGARFKISAIWVDGWCDRCFTPFSEMVKWQKLIESHNKHFKQKSQKS